LLELFDMLDLSLFETYETPEDVRISPKRFLFGRRLALYLDFFKIVLRCRRWSLKGIFSDPAFWDQSDKIREVMEQYGGRFHISGLQNLHTQGPFVVVANHMGVLETQIMPWIIGCFSPISVVMKESLYNSWLFGPIAKSTKSIGLSRQNLKADLDLIMKEGVQHLSKGRSIVIFPEGTRKNYFSKKQFNSLGVKLAGRAGAKVVPIAIKTDFMEPGTISSYFGPIHPERKVMIAVGEPMNIEGRGKREHQNCLDFIEKNLREWGFPIKEE